MIGRIKVMAGADIAERRRHQDGRIQYETPRGTVDIRVSIYATIHGEKVVMRLLNNRDTLLTIRDIGMAPRMLEALQRDALDAPSGVVMVTGPTGSGKTTTLYAAVNYLNDANTSIITAEDPVEYMIDGISQCSINPKINVSYAETLKHIVRQDPDVIVIGEIRDQFSAEVAINAALTGHKVLTTFHTEDSIGGLIRLLNMNIEAFLISSTVVSVIAQRLVRRVCPQCAEPHVLTPGELARLGYQPAEASGLTFARGRGCPACRHIGYKGRVAVFEILVLNELVRDALLSRKTAYEIRRVCVEASGLVTLLEDGITKAAAGLTSFEEIIRQLPRPRFEVRSALGSSSVEFDNLTVDNIISNMFFKNIACHIFGKNIRFVFPRHYKHNLDCTINYVLAYKMVPCINMACMFGSRCIFRHENCSNIIQINNYGFLNWNTQGFKNLNNKLNLFCSFRGCIIFSLGTRQ